MKKYLHVILIPVLTILALPIILSIFNLFKVEVPALIYLLIIIITFFISGIFLGLNTKEKAYIKGIILGSIYSVIMLLLALILRAHFSWFVLTYYLIIIMSTTLGAVLGVNKQKK